MAAIVEMPTEQATEVGVLKARIAELEAKLSWYEEQFRLAQRQRFAASSEQMPPIGWLFDEAELSAAPSQPEPVLEQVVRLKRAKPGRRPLPKDLPRERRVHALPEAEQVCACGHPLHVIGEELSEQLEIIPAQVKVIEHVRIKYACRACEEGVQCAPLPPQPIPRSLASPSVLAHIVVSKFADALPLYRLSRTLERSGVQLPRATLANWVIRAGQLGAPLIERLRTHLCAGAYARADETPVQVLHEPGRAPQTKSTMWVYGSAGTGPPLWLFDYTATREAIHPRRVLAGFSGYLQVDGYGGYPGLEASGAIRLVGCWAHARRKFHEALQVLPKAARREPGPAQHALEAIGALYGIEHQARDLAPAARQALRQQASAPLLAELKAWLDTLATQVLPKSLLGQAVSYTLNQWPLLIRYLDDGALSIDNNAAERAIKPFVIGRKNWLFTNTPNGAHASAIHYSLVETAKANGHEPFAYLRHVFTILPSIDRSDPDALDTLLPWNLDPKAI